MDALYTAAAGMIAQNQQLALVAGNLANADSPGYLAQTGTFIAFPQGTVTRQGVSPGVVGSSSDGVALTSGLNPAAGGVNPTNQPTDFAILGAGFFQVKTPTGIAYTRDGHFSLDAQGHLVTAAGDSVLANNGQPITLAPGPFTVSPTGVISQNNQVVATLALTGLQPTGMTSLGNNLYRGTPSPFTGSVEQGALNTSNVDLATAAAQLIEAQTRYQSLAQMVNEESNRLKAATTLGVVG
ncbi:MAG: flagellar hook-basal body protein [Sulfobacillus sp.]|nr:flagellar hook-basal body protein [Sulfobacillus sp.]